MAKISCKVDYQLPFYKIKNRAIIFFKKDVYIQDKNVREQQKIPFEVFLAVWLCSA